MKALVEIPKGLTKKGLLLSCLVIVAVETVVVVTVEHRLRTGQKETACRFKSPLVFLCLNSHDIDTR